MSRKLIQTKKTTLSYGINDSSTSMQLDELLKLDSTSVSASDIGDLLYGTYDPGTASEEIFSIVGSNVVINSDGTVSITGIVRGLKEVDPYTTGGFACDHGAGAVVVFGNNPQLYKELAWLANDNDYAGLNRFLGVAPQTDTAPVSGNDIVNLTALQAAILGTLTTINLIVPGTAGATIVAGNLVYYDDPTNQWKLASASAAATCSEVLLGIAQGSGTSGNPISSGVLLQGVDTHQSALTDGVTMYTSNTPGAISTSAGTVNVVIGISKGTTQLYFAPGFNQKVTQDMINAMAGTSGTAPSGSNKFVDNADTTGTGLVQRASAIAGINKTTLVAGAIITAGQPLHITPYYQSDGGVLLDSQGSTNGSSTTKSITISNNTNRALLVAVNAPSAPSNVSFNGVLMTLIDSQVYSNTITQTLYVYRLVAPTVTTANISVTGVTPAGISYASYYNVDQTTPVEASAKSNGAAPSVTSLTQGAMIHAFGGESHSSGSTSSTGASATSKYVSSFTVTPTSDITGNTNIGSASIGKFNEVVSSAVSVAFSGGFGTVGLAVMGIALKPVTALSIAVVPASSAPITTNEPLIDFIGFADSSVSSGASIVLTVAGIVTGLSGLTPGKKYYLQDSAGTIGTTRGSYGKIIGKALSATTLMITQEKTVGLPIAKATAYTYTAECDGFAIVNGVSAAASVVTDGITSSITGTGTSGSYLTIPVSRGKTYVITSASGILYFTPLS